jgi:hypothetical protein
MLPGIAAVLLAAGSTLSLGQQAGHKAPSVTVAPIAQLTVTQGRQASVTVQFRVAPGFHINSNTPKSQFLIPTILRMDPPTDIAIGRISYPDGKDMSFPFAPDEPLNVYTGDFAVDLAVHPLHTVVPGRYAMHGQLKYQACDNAACYPPKTLPIDIQVKVLKAPSRGGHNPAQSPHAHQ